MKAPVGLLSDRTVLRQQDGGASPRQVRVYQGEHLSIKNGSETNDDYCTDHGKDDRLFRREYP